MRNQIVIGGCVIAQSSWLGNRLLAGSGLGVFSQLHAAWLRFIHL